MAAASTLAELTLILNRAPRGSLFVLNFWADWAEPSKHMTTVADELAKQFPSVVFVKVEAESSPEISVFFRRFLQFHGIPISMTEHSHTTMQPVTEISSAQSLDSLRRQFTARSQNGVLPRSAFMDILEGAISDEAGQKADHVRQLSAIYDTFDKNKNGEVDIDEFTAGIKVLFTGSEDEKLEFAFQGLDADGDGCITRKEFLQHFHRYFQAQCAVDGMQFEAHRWKAMESHFLRVFRATDVDSSGTLDIKEFKQVVKNDPDHPFSLVWAALSRPKSRQLRG
jgi:Ca2+-binding EF-hand superfamily protein